MPRAPPSGRTVEHRLMGRLFLQGQEGFLASLFLRFLFRTLVFPFGLLPCIPSD